MEAPQKKYIGTIHLLVAGLVIHFAGIFHLSFSVQKLFKNFMLVQWLKNFSIFGGNFNPKKFLCNYPDPQKALP
jgi:hypothetical protein